MVIGALDACSFKGVLVFGFENCPEQKNKYLGSGVFGSEIMLKRQLPDTFEFCKPWF